MWEIITTTLSEFFTSGEIWVVIIKVLVTALLTAGLGFIGTCIGKLVAKNKESKIYRYATICVRAAEQKFPNEGKKMGPEKMAYVMDQLAIKFPKIKENTYFYNIAEAAVLGLNRELRKEEDTKVFEEKYGEKPIAALEQPKNSNIEEESSTSTVESVEDNVNAASNENISKNTAGKIKSF